jgi:Co/Zn/Cd efflux system component
MEDEDSILRKSVLRRLYLATGLCTCFLLVEVAGGLLSHSLAILSDAAHLLADIASFVVASKCFSWGNHYSRAFRPPLSQLGDIL